MKRYRVLVGRLFVRKLPHPKSDIIHTLVRGEEFFSDSETPPANGAVWAERFVAGQPRGFVCVRDLLNRYLEEIPQPSIPPVAEVPPVAGVVTREELDALVRRVKALENIAGIGKNE